MRSNLSRRCWRPGQPRGFLWPRKRTRRRRPRSGPPRERAGVYGRTRCRQLVEQLGLDAPDELAFAVAAIDGVAQSAPAQRPTVRLEPHLTNGRERRVSYDNGRAKPAPPQASTLGLPCYALIDKVIARDGEGRRHSREPNQAENQMNLVAAVQRSSAYERSTALTLSRACPSPRPDA